MITYPQTQRSGLIVHIRRKGPSAMDRKEKLLRHIDKNKPGIEIGPSHNPIAPKKEGYLVHVIDHMSREDLIEKYKDHNVNLENIEEVDFVWRGENYSELTGKRTYYDWVVASHVIEHTPDLIGFLNDCDSILKDDGVISLAVPDKRYCFDHCRPVTGIARIIDSHFQKNRIHTRGTVSEHFLNSVSRAGKFAWDSRAAGECKFEHSSEDALRRIEAALKENAYTDVHAWCFVPHSFRLMIHDLFCLGLIHVQEVDFFPTAGCEFYITLGRNGKGINKSRLQMLDIIESEIKDAAPVSGNFFETLTAKNVNYIKSLAKRFIRPLFRYAPR